MRLKSFTVQGFKNLTGPATLGPLQPINVLHGTNNVGKTNVLQAMDALFRLLRTGNQVSKDQVVSLESAAQPAGYPFDEMYNLQSPGAIRWWVELAIERAELEAEGIEPNFATEHIAISTELAPGLGTAQFRVTRFQIGEIDAAARDPERDAAIVGFAQQLRSHIGRTYALDAEKVGSPFVLLNRCTRGPEDRGLVPQPVRDALFDARQSLDREERRRWSLFVQLARELEPELGPGQFDTAFDRATGRANLIYDAGDGALPVDWLGAGIQQFVALLAPLVLSRAVFVGLEEPELHLSYSLQQRFRRVLQAIAEHGGPQQFFVSSHSTALDDAESSFVMEVRDGAPVIEQRAWQDSSAPPRPAPAPAREYGASLQEPAPPAVAAAPPAPAPPAPDLDALIGLVDQLAELDPVAIVPQTTDATEEKQQAVEAAGPSRPANRAEGAGNGQRVVDAAPWRRSGKK